MNISRLVQNKLNVKRLSGARCYIVAKPQTEGALLRRANNTKNTNNKLTRGFVCWAKIDIMTRSFFYITFSICVVTFFSMPVVAASVIVHSGSNDPVSEGWTYNSVGAGSVGGGTEATTSGSYDYWRVQDAATCSGCATNYEAFLDTDDLLGDWTLSSTLRIVDQSLWGNHVLVADGLNYWSIYFRNDSGS